MELVPYGEFSRLRLRQFCPRRTKIESLGSDGEYMGRSWSGEGIRGVDFLWQKKGDRQLACILLTLQPTFCPSDVEEAILAAIRLRLRRGMTSVEVRRLLGKPATRAFGSDWETVKFRYGCEWPYLVMADFGSDTGLRSLNVARLDALPEDVFRA